MLKTPQVGKRNFHTAPSVNLNDPNMVSGWNMQTAGGRVMDVKGPNHGTITPTVVNARTPWGECCLDFQNGGYVNCGNNASLDFTTQTFGGWVWANCTSGAGTDRLFFCRGANVADGYYFYLTPSNKLDISTHQAGTRQDGLSLILPSLNRWYLFGFLSIAGGNNLVYVNAVDNTDVPLARVNPVTAARNFYISRYETGGFTFPGQLAAPFIGTFASKAAFESAIKAEYNRVARKLIYREDFEAAPIMFAAAGAGAILRGTDIQVLSGTWQIVFDATLGKKVLKCVTAGDSRIPVPQGNAAYGKWEADLYFHNVDTYWKFIDQPDRAGYMLLLRSTGDVWIGWYGPGPVWIGALLQSAAGYLTNNTWYRFRITRTTEGVFTVYVKGGIYIDWTIVSAAGGGGTNPFTNNTYTLNSTMHFYSTAGDMIADIEKYFGVEIP